MTFWRNPLMDRVRGDDDLSRPAVSAPCSPDSAATAAREHYILGRPPRLPPLPPAEHDDEAKAIVANMRQAVGAAPSDELPEFFATMLRHPQLMEKQVALSAQFHRGQLAPRDRQLAILRTAWLCQAPYEWGQHVEASKRMAGITSAEIERVTLGSEAPEWSGHDRAILRAVEELFEHAIITDDTWEALASTLNDQQLLELPVLIGTYQTIAYLLNTVRFRLMDNHGGLTAR